MSSLFAKLRAFRRKISAVCVAMSVCPTPACEDLVTSIRKLGFQEIVPPTTFSGPGALIYIRDTHPLRTGVICPPDQSLGPHFQPRESPTQQSQFSKTRKRHFAIGADLLSQIKKDVSFHAIKTITMTLSNPKIFIVADTDVIMYQNDRTEICRRAVQRRVDANQFRISMISETLQGDVTYSVAFETGVVLSAEAKVDLLSNLKAKLKLVDAEIKGNAIVGRALVWGIVDDQWLAKSTMEDPVAPQREPRAANSRAPSEIVAVGAAMTATPLEEITEEECDRRLSEDSDPVTKLPRQGGTADTLDIEKGICDPNFSREE